jgi:hypothetical protein
MDMSKTVEYPPRSRDEKRARNLRGRKVMKHSRGNIVSVANF